MLKSYKYRNGSSALRTLSEASLHFASPATLNDILEAKFDCADGAHFYDEFYAALDELASQRDNCVNPLINNSIPEGLQAVTDSENTRLKEACEKVGIFSSSIRPDNQPLWAYYGNNFRGVCFEFEWPKSVLDKYQIIPVHVDYSKKQRVINRASDARNLLIDIGVTNPDWSLEEIMDYSLSEDFRRRWGIMSTIRAVSTKHVDWIHEEEIRFIAPRVMNLPIYGILKRVYFVKDDFPEYISIIRLLHQLYSDVEMIRLKFNHIDPVVSAQRIDFKEVPVSEEDNS